MVIAEQGVPLGSGSAFGHAGPSPEKAGMNRWSPSDAYVGVVVDFLDQLETRGRRELAWNLVTRLHRTGSFSLTTWAQRLLRGNGNQDRQLWKRVVRDLAVEATASPHSSAIILREAFEWLDHKEIATENMHLIREAILALPIAVSELFIEPAERKETSWSYSEFLRRPVDSERRSTVTTLWERAFMHPDFGHAAASFQFAQSNELDASAAVAISLLKLGNACGDGDDAAIFLAGSVLSGFRGELRSQTKRWLLAFAENIARQRRDIPMREENEAQRARLYRIYEICKTLASL